MQIKALVELITSLMCIAPSRGAGASFSHFQEMMRAMLDAGVLKALLQVLRGLDVNHPKAHSQPSTAFSDMARY